MKLNRCLAGLLVATSVAFTLPAHAHREPGAGHDMRGGPAGMRVLRQLDLSQEQREQAARIFQEQRPVLRERANAARAAHDALRKAATDPNADSGRIRQLADAVGRAHADMAVLRAETMQRIAGLLTPEQRAKLEQARPAERRRGRE